MEMDSKSYGSKGVAGAGLGLGIAGTALGVLAGGLGNVGNLGIGAKTAPDSAIWNAALIGAMSKSTCNEDHTVNRYEAAQAARIAELETEVKLRDSNIYTDGKILDLYRYVDGKFACVESQLCEQRVYNATNTSALGCLQGQVAQLLALTKTVIPAANICPAPMPQYNSWTAPTTPTTAG